MAEISVCVNIHNTLHAIHMVRCSNVQQQIVAWKKLQASTSKIICAMHVSSTLTGDESKPDQIMSEKRVNIIDFWMCTASSIH